MIPHPENEIPGPVSDIQLSEPSAYLRPRLCFAPASKEVGAVSSFNNVTGVGFPSQTAAVPIPLGGTEDRIRVPDVGWKVGRQNELITHLRVEAQLRSKGSELHNAENPQQGHRSSCDPHGVDGSLGGFEHVWK